MRGDPGFVQDTFSEVRERAVGCLYTELAIHHGLRATDSLEMVSTFKGQSCLNFFDYGNPGDFSDRLENPCHVPPPQGIVCGV